MLELVRYVLVLDLLLRQKNFYVLRFVPKSVRSAGIHKLIKTQNRIIVFFSHTFTVATSHSVINPAASS
jgi:hypothetical protein